MSSYETLEQMVLSAAEAVRPPERLTVAEAAEKYRWLNNAGSYVGPFKNSMTPYLVQPMETLTSLDYTGMIFVGPAQSGKALALDTPIATPTGWTTMGDLKVGDEVFGSDGKPTVVLAATGVMHNHECFRVEFDDGTSIIADADHKWAVEDRTASGGSKRNGVLRGSPRGRERVMTTAEMVEAGARFRGGKRARFRIPNAEPLQLPAADLPVDPYLFGVWLGDGARDNGLISAAPEDIPHVLEAFRAAGYEPTVYDAPNRDRAPAVNAPGWAGTLRAAGFLPEYKGGAYVPRAKRLPGIFLRASEHQRRELVRGLMDTDGGTSRARPRRVEFTQKEEPIWRAAVEALRTLGIKPRVTHRYVKLKGELHGPYARVTFSVEDPADVFRMKRKAEIDTAQKARPSQVGQRSITAIEPVESVPVRCIRVAAEDHLFLAGEGMVPTHNSDMSLNWLTYSVVSDPADFMHIDKAQASARDWYQRRADKLFRDSAEVKKRLMPGKHHQSTYSTRFRSGMLYTLSWPTVNELSGKPVGRLWLADYDRMDEDVGGEGSPYDLAVQRMKSFGRFGMCAAESSPSRTIENSRWLPKTKHEAPPTTGILALYNRGDRRRWYWPCAACGAPFEPDFSLFEWPDSEDMLEAAEQVVMKCPHCGHAHRDSAHEPTGTPGKREMNRRGFWLRDGETFNPETGEIEGTAIRSRTASFWLKGPAATFADWTDMTLKYLKAVAEFEATGSEEALKTTTNTDQGMPYLPAGLEQERLPEELKARARDLGERVVPEGVRFLLATVDVQARRFEVQIHGVGVNENPETGELRPDMWIIDRYKIRKSGRLDEDDDPLPLDPGGYVEDWHLLTEKVLLSSYPLGDDSDRTMQVRMMAVDSGGRDGVTANAYEYWRQLRKDGRNLHRRVQLLKGDHRPTAPLVKIDYPDAERKDRRAQTRGEIPVMFVNSNAAKDAVNNMLSRETPGGGMVFFPDWLPDWWFVELTAETKTAKGWVNPGKARNEAWDLLVYAVALAHSSKIRLPHIDWERPPAWAAEWDENDLVAGKSKFRFDLQPKGDRSLRELAEKLG